MKSLFDVGFECKIGMDVECQLMFRTQINPI